MTTMAAITTLTATLLSGAAHAHPEFQSADPAPGAATTTSPKQMRITFNENLVAKLSGVEVKD